MKKRKRDKKVILAVTLLLAVALWLGCRGLLQNPRVRLLLSVIHFAEKTLGDEEYLACGVDVMQLIRDYLNADTQITGEAGFFHVKALDVSMSAKLTASRSFSQKRFAASAILDVLWIEAGEIDIYAEDETVYLVVPMLDGLANAFPTGVNLFMKMPDLTSDLNKEWFRESASDIVQFLREIEVEETGAVLTDEDGSESEEFVITIHRGSGHFIWELLGMKDPDYDVSVSLYLTGDNCLRRMTLDLSDVLEGATLVIDGKNVGTAVFTYELPDEERLTVTMVRNPAYRRWMDIRAEYETNLSEIYSVSAALKWEAAEDGFSVHVNDVVFSCDGEVLGEAYFTGNVTPCAQMPDVFEGKDTYLYGLEKIDWRSIRADAEGFMNDILDKMSGKLFFLDRKK